MKMNHIAKVAAAALLTFGVTAAMAQITGSKHDLSYTGALPTPPTQTSRALRSGTRRHLLRRL